MGKKKDFVAISMLHMYPNKATVCSVGMVKVKNNEIVDEFHSLVNPPEELQFDKSEKLQSLHGITEDITEGAPSFIDVLPKMEEFIEGLPLVVHNGIAERFIFIHALEYYREKGNNIHSYLESVRFIDTKKMHGINLVTKRYEALHDARLYAKFYMSQDLEDVLYPEIKKKKRPDVTKEQMAYAKTKEDVSPFVFDKYDYSQVENPDNIYYGMGAYITGNLEIFESKDYLHLLLRDKLGVKPYRSHSKSRKDFILICGSNNAGPAKKELANEIGQIIIQEEELYEELLSMGYDISAK